MCGIAGMYGRPDEELMRNMVDSLSHRGPDDVGHYTDEEISFGVRRLSIVDSDNGRQPLTNEEGDVYALFNGEIYNHEELRDSLKSAGHSFSTDTDGEVIPHLYEENRKNFVKELDGMFAFALWDTSLGRLVLGRDRVGIKPLYYTSHDGRLYFASEIKGVLQAPVPRTVDTKALDAFWALDYVPAPRTGFKNIKKVKPGTTVIHNGEQTRQNNYWGPPHHTSDRSEAWYKAQVREKLEAAVERRMMGEHDAGVFLSGGVDSSTVTGILSRIKEKPVKTFSARFGYEEHDEGEFSQLASEHFETDHTDVVVGENDIDKIEDILGHMDEPLADPAVVPNYLLAEQASKETKVVNVGSGADELLGGRDHYPRQLKLRRRYRRAPSILKKLALKLSGGRNDTELRSALSEFGASNSQEELYLYCTTWGGQKEDYPLIYKHIQDVFEHENYLTNMSSFDIKYWLPDDLLHKGDRTTMAHSLEARVPYLDSGLISLSRKIPPKMKVRNGMRKYILRKAVKDILPDKILKRKKKGFSVPFKDWILNPYKPLSGRFQEERLESVPTIDAKDTVRAYSQAPSSYKKYLWKALVLQIWYENWVVEYD